MQNSLLRHIVRAIYGVYYRIYIRTSGNTFCWLFNMQARVINAPVRMQYDSATKLYLAKGDGRALHFKHPIQANYAYKYGIRQRAYSLARDYFIDRIDFRPGDVVVDCGANIGDLKLYFDFETIPVKYVAIEPSPDEFSCLELNIKALKTAPAPALEATLHNFGLWNEDGKLKFFVSSDGADSSLITPANYTGIVDVATTRLDKLIPDQRIKLFKLEAEGAEPEVIEGCSGILKNIEYIAADLGPERGVAGETTVVFVTNFLLRHGFELLHLSHDRVCALFRNKALL